MEALQKYFDSALNNRLRHLFRARAIVDRLLRGSPSDDQQNEIRKLELEILIAYYSDLEAMKANDIRGAVPDAWADGLLEQEIERLCEQAQSAFDAHYQTLDDDNVTESDVDDLYFRYCFAADLDEPELHTGQERFEQWREGLEDIREIGKARRVLDSLTRNVGDVDMSRVGGFLPAAKKGLYELIGLEIDYLCHSEQAYRVSCGVLISDIRKKVIQLSDLDQVWNECFLWRGWKERVEKQANMRHDGVDNGQ